MWQNNRNVSEQSCLNGDQKTKKPDVVVSSILYLGCFGVTLGVVFILIAIGVAILMWAFNR